MGFLLRVSFVLPRCSLESLLTLLKQCVRPPLSCLPEVPRGPHCRARWQLVPPARQAVRPFFSPHSSLLALQSPFLPGADLDPFCSGGIEPYTGVRGHPANDGPIYTARHPLVRTNPITGWKGLFVNQVCVYYLPLHWLSLTQPQVHEAHHRAQQG